MLSLMRSGPHKLAQFGTSTPMRSFGPDKSMTKGSTITVSLLVVCTTEQILDQTVYLVKS